MNRSTTAFSPGSPGRSTEHSASFGVVKRRYYAATSLPAGLPGKTASNDAFFARPAATTPDDAWARRAATANSFGDAMVASAALTHSAPPVLNLSNREHHSSSLRQIVIAIVEAFGKFARRCYTRWRQSSLEAATAKVLGQLDNRTLRDLGLDRSELRSIAVEWTSEAHPTRTHALVSLRRLAL